ncbi:MAG: xanthine dehydrogenase family protein molybdopterin-binding subunit [Planctomycetota bacterium]|jgi:xanthine dehydrogenase molybdenum-binding subunit|nr:4-hydroxybenzoyl-CoA reductase [Candidatus Woesearchaeota archaeon]MDP6386489.1 xanthine dehydrogenase family protein molybdopterin-binding subunit [Planctomycetota bacterium]
MSSTRYVGTASARPEGGDKVKGRAQYIHDISVPGMLHGQIKYSDHAHARIKNIDTSRAEALPGVHAVITAFNTPEIPMGFMGDNRVLKKDKVRQFRDEIAAVAATDPDTARRAVELIEVEYEPLPGVFSVEEALAEGAPLIHETDARGKPLDSNRLPLIFAHDSGDVDGAESQAKFVAEGEFSTPLIQQACMGTAGALSEFDGRGNLTITAKTQIPFLAQRDFTKALGALGLKGRNVRVVVPALGGGFGTGLDTHVYEYVSILLAWRTGRPVKVLYDREQEFAYLSPRQSTRSRVRQGIDEQGRLVFRAIDITQDNGAYASWGATYPSVMLLPSTSLYRVPNIRFRSEIVYTNNTYCQAMRGYGNPEVTLGIESTLDELAELSGIDPMELRRINCNQPGEETPMGLRVTTCGLSECLDRTAEKLDWSAKRGQGRSVSRGVGVSSLIHVGGGGKIYRSDGSGIILKLDDYGCVNVNYGGVEMGQGLHSAISLMVADGLGVTPDQVLVNPTDTATCPWDVGTHASRGAFMAGNAALKACERLRERLFEWAPRMYPDLVAANLKRGQDAGASFDPSLIADLSSEQFDLLDGEVFARDVEGLPDLEAAPWLRVNLGTYLRAIHFPRDGSEGTVFAEEAFYEPPTQLPDWEKGIGNMSANYTYGCQGIEVEVDEETGEVKVLKLVAALDVGRVLNPQTLKGQVYGGIAQGLGYALYEQVLTHEGRVQNPGFTDYKIPTASEMDFPIELEFVETNDPSGPFGAKGVGEPGLVPTAPAMANAVQDAIGVRIRDLPITPEKILAALKDRDEA